MSSLCRRWGGIAVKDEFLSEEDLDLAALSEAELLAYWDLWLHQAQATNDLDAHLYSHGVFVEEPGRRSTYPASFPGSGLVREPNPETDSRPQRSGDSPDSARD